MVLERAFIKPLKERLQEEYPLIQVVIGPRQVGKTTGVLQLKKAFPKLNYVSADDAPAKSEGWIREGWQKAIEEAGNTIPMLAVDEVQKIDRWSAQVKQLWDAQQRSERPFKLILLGSSSLHLAQGLEESLAGRFELIRAHHWGFEESQRAFGYSLEEFLYFGGYPRASEFRKDCTRWRSYLRDSIIESVIGKDILRFAEVRKPALFRQCFELVTSLPAQEVSYNKLLGQLQEGGNTDLVKYYLELFQGAFLVKSLFKFSDSNLRKKSSSPKILPLCPALASHHYDLEDLKGDLLGRMFEVAVGQVLAQLPGDLTYWREQDGKFEVDYIYQDGKKLFAIEVKSGRKKSQRGLQEFLKRHPRAVGGFIDTNNFEKWAKAPLSVMAKWV